MTVAGKETKRTLIMGAGPFGLALSAYARAHGIAHTVVGRPMDFWKQQMPKGMLLRSRCDWHLDPLDEHTIEHYLETRNRRSADVELSLKFCLDYCDWFTEQKDFGSFFGFTVSVRASATLIGARLRANYDGYSG